MTIVLISEESCAPCKALKLFAKENNINFDETYDVTTEEGVNFARKYGIRAVPTVITFEDSTEVSRFTGMDLNNLNKLITE